MKSLRKLAQGKSCMVRIPDFCDGGGETTILAHYSLAGISGRGLKSPDLLGAWCCSSCHSVIDFRVNTRYDRDMIRLWFAEGVFRTQYELIKLDMIYEADND